MGKLTPVHNIQIDILPPSINLFGHQSCHNFQSFHFTFPNVYAGFELISEIFEAEGAQTIVVIRVKNEINKSLEQFSVIVGVLSNV